MHYVTDDIQALVIEYFMSVIHCKCNRENAYLDMRQDIAVVQFRAWNTDD